jgi:hypothetical protein
MTLRLTIVPSGPCRKIAASLVGAVALVVGLLVFVGPPSTQAVAAQTPGPCGTVLLAGSSWLGGSGVPVYSNGRDEGSGSSCGGTNYITNRYVSRVESGSEWQCTELVNRLYLTRGWTRSFWPGEGGESALGAHDSMYDEAPPGLSSQPNGSISYVGPGDVVSINEFKNGVFEADGHVAVVNTPDRVTSGQVDLVSQNSGDAASADVERTANLGRWTVVHPELRQVDLYRHRGRAPPAVRRWRCSRGYQRDRVGFQYPGRHGAERDGLVRGERRRQLGHRD